MAHEEQNQHELKGGLEGDDAPLAALRRLHLVFRGQVQGVGIRWTSQIKARKVGCTGWVHNERDGSVTMELQGTDDQIARYFGEFGRAYARYPIDYVIDDKKDIPVVDGEADFVVRLYRY